MMWFFAILVVLVMGGVAALASGRGAPMSKAYDDRPDALVPSHGPLQAEDVRRVRFSLAFRGYRMSEVDALLDRVARELDLVAREQDRAEEPPPEEAEDPDVAGQDQVADQAAVREARGDDPMT
jgi:DivIVA domain-containing protein